MISDSISGNKTAKNDSRIASLMGTWTGVTNIKTDFGQYSLKADYILHMSGDAMRINTCSLAQCSEIDNKICQKEMTETNISYYCGDMGDTISDWSDVLVFLYANVLVENKKGLKEERTTGGWIGPYSIVFAQNKTAITKSLQPAPGDIVDQYMTKYATTPTTPYISSSTTNTLLDNKDFTNMLGINAIKNTAMKQSLFSNSTSSFSKDTDPYIDVYKTCEHGNLEALLPLLDFTFVVDKNGNEQLNVKFQHKLLVAPGKGTVSYYSMPLISKFLPVSGPYCYNDDPKGAYSFDIAFDSSVPNSLLTLEHACIEGLPCVPPELAQFSRSHNEMKPNEMPGPVILEVGTIVSLSIALAIVSALFMISFYFNCHKKNTFNGSSIFERSSGIPSEVIFQDVIEDETAQNDLKTPLLSEKSENDDLSPSNLKKSLSIGSTKKGIMFV